MITTQNITLRFGSQTLFENVNVKFTPGNCYGLIGANGAGKSTFLKIISGDLEPTSGEIHITKGQRLGILRQNHFEFNECPVMDTVIMGHARMWQVMKEKEALYSKPDFNDADGIKVSELEEEFATMDGYQAEAMAASLLSNLGIGDEKHYELVKNLPDSEKVKVLLAQALFANPDILLLDEPTNHLDIHTISWLEEFLINYQNTVIVVSHDRNFLDNVCTHIADIDYNNVQLYTGNYTFWSQASQLMQKQKEEKNKRTEEKMEELKAFIARFSANASKAKQATSRKNMLDKLSLEEIKPSSRQYPRIRFTYNKIPGKDVLKLDKISKTINGQELLRNFSLEVNRGEKIAFLSKDPLILTTLFQIIEGEIEPDSGKVEWGTTATHSYFPKDNNKFFETNINLIDWLRQFSPDPHINYIRGFLGRMLFSAEEADKSSNVLSGGEKVRCMFAKMMVQEANVLILDEPTNHLDLESITALNNSLIDYNGVVLFTSQDHRFIQTVADKIVEISPNGWIASQLKYEEYMLDPQIRKKREGLYTQTVKV